MRYVLYTGFCEQFEYTLSADPRDAMRRAREIMYVTRTDIYKFRKEPVGPGYPAGTNKYRIYIHTRIGGVRKVQRTNRTFLIMRRHWA